MKAIILRASVIFALLVFISAMGAMPTLSRSEKNQKENLGASTQKKSVAARRRPAPLSYRSPGGFHKLSVPDPILAEKILSSGKARKSRRFGTHTIIEISEAALGSLEAGDLERVDMRDDMNLVLLRRGQIDTTAPKPRLPEELRQTPSQSDSLHLVQLFGPPTPQDIAVLKSTGAKLISYIPNNAYLIWAAPYELQRLRSARMQELIQWEEPLHPAYKLDRLIALDSLQPIPVSISMVDSPQSQSSIERIKSASLKILMPEFQSAGAIHLKALIPSARLIDLARLAEVMLIEPWPRIRLHDERANQIVAGDIQQETINNAVVSRPARPGYSSFLNLHGFTSNFDFAIDISDTGLDSGTDDPARIHPDFLDSEGRSRIAYLFDYTQDELLHTSPVLPWHDPTGHGTINASLAGGMSRGSQFADSLGFQFGQGTAPFVRFGISKIFNDEGDFTNVVSIPDIVASAYRVGARISTNSWGTCDLTFGFCNLYGTDSSIYDSLVRDADSFAPGNQGMTILFSAGNDGLNEPLSIGIPGTAKNVITVGASEGFRPTNESGSNLVDGCNVRASGADNAMDIPGFSSGGPMQDGRAKPDLVAPGTHVTGAASQDSFYAAAASDDVTVCDKYFPVGQTLYALSSGTSHSTPLVAGGAALAFQWLRERLGAEPSPAMVKALILNSTSYLNGALGGDSLPGARQGWGLLNLSRMFEETDRVLYDQPATFTESGGSAFEVTGMISDPTKEFRVMLVWSDAPAAGLTNATSVNQLNLEVIIGGTLYNGNNFSGEYSTTGGGKDIINNVQGVRLPAGVTGPFVIRVRPTVIAGDGVPDNGVDADQDFALVVANGREAAAPVPAVTESEGVAEGVEVRHANQTRDSSLIPGETAFVTITLTNQSPIAAMPVSTASLSLDGGSSAFSSFPAIAAGSAQTNPEPFQVIVPSNLRCGSVAEFRLRVTGEAGAFTLPVRVRIGRAAGAEETLMDDDVDSMRVKWKGKKGFTVATGMGTSGAMSYHAVDPGKESDNSQLSDLKLKKKISIPSAAGHVRLTFFHIFNFEPGFDGGVLEISTDSGVTWEDLGSRIITGGYDGKVTSASGNPLGNRLAWTSRGRAGVFSQVVINLDDFAGQRIQLRFRAGFDGATGVRDGFTGWFIDDIRLTATSFTCR